MQDALTVLCWASAGTVVHLNLWLAVWAVRRFGLFRRHDPMAGIAPELIAENPHIFGGM